MGWAWTTAYVVGYLVTWPMTLRWMAGWMLGPDEQRGDRMSVMLLATSVGLFWPLILVGRILTPGLEALYDLVVKD